MGALLLTDEKQNLAELFRPGEEVAAYANQVTQFLEYPTNVVGILKFAQGAIGKTSASFDVAGPYKSDHYRY